ncbi:chemotaxis protein CheA [candidate division GN15 bacterium]|uniref:histidine kinase n=1 Tax=candidate division GN15 bacterium TaxID=2072418 RepID=A0A855X2N0_9BACT|nr:MAG: chemotaxis protein CheA [candidate division GN15 bacterium]
MTTDANLELDDMKEIIGDFLIETDELLHSLDTNLVKLESAPDDLNLLNEIFRAAHTIKGTSSFLGFEQVTTLTHKMEDVLNKLRKGELKVTPVRMDVLLESLDLLKQLVEMVRSGHIESVDLSGILAMLEVQMEGGAAPGTTIASPAATVAQPTTAPIRVMESAAKDQPASFDKTTAASPVRPGAEKKVVDQTIRVDVNRLDSLMNLMGELVLSRNSLVQTVGTINKDEVGGLHAEKLNQAAASVNYITTELQMAVMRMRMQPIGKVFSKFPRLVRDLSRDSKKQIDLILTGEETELDKSVIEEIGDPLVHIIRNSCDHGIELPKVREAGGKPAKGTIKLDACQEGSNIVIRIQDDGKGLDPDAIREKAIERGLGTRAEIEKMADRDIFRFIFEAGLSTAKVVTDVSGRGVGMDVVRTNIEKLNGQIELDSKRGAGTTITIKLPLTLAILQGLLVEADHEVYILPLSSVIETVRTEQSDVSYINQRPVLRLRDEIIPIINFASCLRGQGNAVALAEKPYVVVVGLAEQKLGINIDRFLGQEEVVIKSLGSYLGTTEGVAGATILGDGRIRLIIDLIGLFNLARRKR